MSLVLLATPVEKELAALEALLLSEGHLVQRQPGRVPSLAAPDLGLTCAAAGHGKAQFALVTQHLIDTRGPFEAVIVVGAAGALSPDLQAGDVVVGTEAVEHDYKTRFHGVGPPPRHPSSRKLRETILSAQPERDGFRVHSGPIAGGDEDIVDPVRAAALVELTGALCVAWEGAGGARAAAFSNVPFVEIRAVTDGADASAAESYRVHLPEAIGNIGRVLLAWRLHA
ncbi:5'-methylthioadenosine/S-adenosylhomocysteine nucleosidase [Rubrivirga sp.]|uniref:5'-methylthioadenosine/S-adenosylhomocysteine nucleosidase n=1 Tax=Rubrivirga sp. TaxID=1885344 RepID=UPI003C742701